MEIRLESSLQLQDTGDMRPTEGIAVDAAHSIKKGITEFQAINLSTGERLFYKNLGNQTVNIGEFLGVVECVKFILENDFKPKVIYTDSQTAITWYRNRSTSSVKRNSELQKAEIFLHAMSSRLEGIKVVHWDNDRWGETPADFGNK